MRAGPYAEVDGVVYPCVRIDQPYVRLLAFWPGSAAPVPGFEHERADRWSRAIDRSEATRLFWVRTTAVWSGRTVEVGRVQDDRATLIYNGTDMPTDNPAIARLGPFEWQGTVPLGELSEVVEVIVQESAP